MRYLSGEDEEKAIKYINEAAQIAMQSNCFYDRCGSVIVKNNEIIGTGFNSPPGNKKLEFCLKDNVPVNFKSDRACCVHAEQRAIMDALKHNSDKIVDSELYFIRLDDNGKPAIAGKPYCTICSKMALDVGIKEFVLWHEKGICVYDIEEYNELSFRFWNS